MKLFVEIKPDTGPKIDTETVARLLASMAAKLWSKDFELLQGPQNTRTVLLKTDVIGAQGELVTAPFLPCEEPD